MHLCTYVCLQYAWNLFFVTYFAYNSISQVKSQMHSTTKTGIQIYIYMVYTSNVWRIRNTSAFIFISTVKKNSSVNQWTAPMTKIYLFCHSVVVTRHASLHILPFIIILVYCVRVLSSMCLELITTWLNKTLRFHPHLESVLCKN